MLLKFRIHVHTVALQLASIDSTFGGLLYNTIFHGIYKNNKAILKNKI